MTTKVTLPLDQAIAWQSMGRSDEFSFAMSLIRWLVDQEFLTNPDPQFKTIQVTIERDQIIFEKVNRS